MPREVHYRQESRPRIPLSVLLIALLAVAFAAPAQAGLTAPLGPESATRPAAGTWAIPPGLPPAPPTWIAPPESIRLPSSWEARSGTLSTTGETAPMIAGASTEAVDVGVVTVYRPTRAFAIGLNPGIPPIARFVLYVLYGIVFLICVYAVRHYLFTYSRLLGRQRHPYVPIDDANWPGVTVFVPCHNEERVVHSALDALLRVDYPQDRIHIVPVNDRSTDSTAEILDAYAAAHPGRIRPMHRTGGKPGKAAALQEAVMQVKDDIMLVFDADYIPGRGLIKHLVAPFLDPQVGAVMGRVVPLNTPRNLLTRMLDMERSAGYQVDQQARMNLDIIPQYGGTVGGVRISALHAVGGWRDDALSEDTDITLRLVLAGWKIAYSNRYECYEEVPETWPVRIRQIKRWARGHTDAAIRYMPSLFYKPGLKLRERVDGVLLLGTYLMAPLLLMGWVLALLLFFMGANPFLGAVAVLAVASYGTIGNFAAFFEIATAARLDGTYGRIRLLPLILSGFLVSLISTSGAVMREMLLRHEPLQWDKTQRYREPANTVDTAAEPASHERSGDRPDTDTKTRSTAA